MQTQHKIDRARQELKVLQEPPRNNRIRKQLSFLDFIAKRDKLGFGTKTQVEKAMSEEIIGHFDNQEISNAIYCYMASNSDAGEKQIVSNELASKIIAMSHLGDVIVLAACMSSNAK
jgi:hypothetical protein